MRGRIVAGLFLCSLLSVGGDAQTDRTEKGTIIKETGRDTVYRLIGPNLHVWIKPCGDFQTGQTVDYRTEGDKAYIDGDHGNEYKCSITQREVLSSEGTSPAYERGTIMGYTVRRDTMRNDTRLAKVYELMDSQLVYLIDYCGAFQAGTFSLGQDVQFRVDSDDDRLYVRHDGNKEYSCQLEGMRFIREH